MNMLLGEFIFEVVRFLLMIILLVAGVLIGGKLRAVKDAKAASKKAGETATE